MNPCSLVKAACVSVTPFLLFEKKGVDLNGDDYNHTQLYQLLPYKTPLLSGQQLE